MKSRRSSEEWVDEELIGLKLTKPERDAIAASSKVTDLGLQDRVRSAPSRRVVSFRRDELEDLHRGLAFDAGQTSNSKRRKTIGNVLRKIEEILDEGDDGDDIFDDLSEYWGDPLTAPHSADELFAAIVGTTPPDWQQASCRIAFTAAERATICGMETIPMDLHKMLHIDSPEVTKFDLTPRQFLTLVLALAEAINLSKDKSHLQSLEQVANTICRDLQSPTRPAVSNGGPPVGPQAVAYQLKITLNGSKPAIWRRVVVPDCTLAELHQTVQVVMGWTNSHLHQFEYGGDRFSDPRFELEGDDDDYDETQVYLSQLVDDGCQKLWYCYDFGDDWMHTIKIEKSLELKPNERLPRCVKGAGACPPEDCGGIWGYYEFLEAVRDPKHERHAEPVDWAGAEFDAGAFDMDETNKALAIGLPYAFDDR